MQALIAAAGHPGFPAEIAGVIANRADASGLLHAASAGIETRVVAHRGFPDKPAFEAALEEAIGELGAELICLAGFMRLLSPAFADRWQGRALNIHPALLPSFRGLDTHARALAEGVRIHGCTVHFLSAETDAGPIVAQAAVPVLAGDTEEALAARVLQAEHLLYPHALALVASGRAVLEGGRVRLQDEEKLRPALVVPALGRGMSSDRLGRIVRSPGRG